MVYSRVFGVPRIRMREIVAFTVGLYIVRVLTCPPNPPPDTPYHILAIDLLHRYSTSANEKQNNTN